MYAGLIRAIAGKVYSRRRQCNVACDKRFAACFPGVPVYCTFEGWEGDTWRALETGKGNLWSFEAALVPTAFATMFSPVPDIYVSKEVPEGIALARRDVWLIPPWEETVNSP